MKVNESKQISLDLLIHETEFQIWGGDNLEMSFRIWQCGGRIEIVPCSHVGHLFRTSSPYTFPGGISNILNENLVRTAKVWMDDWSQFFYKYSNVPETLIDSIVWRFLMTLTFCSILIFFNCFFRMLPIAKCSGKI